MATARTLRTPERPPTPIRWLSPALAALLVIGFIWVGMEWSPPETIPFIDWWAYALGTERVLAGQSLYLPEQLAGPYYLPDVTPEGYVYPPPSALLFLPFIFGQIGLLAWVATNTVVFLLGVLAVLKREFGAIKPMPLALALLGLIVVLPSPGGKLAAAFPSGFYSANVNLLLAGVLALCWAAGANRRWIPYAAGIAGTFKIFPAALTLWAARSYGWRPVAITAAIGIGAAVVTLPLFGLDEWRAFVTAMSNAEPTCDGGRVSIACVALPHIGVTAAKLLGLVIGLMLIGLAVVVRGEYTAFALLTLGMLAPVTDGHHHYLLFIYVLVLIGLARLAARRRPGVVPATKGTTA